MSTDTGIEIVRDDAAHRYEAHLDGQVVGYVDIRTPRPGRVVAVHTRTEPAFEGRGIGGALARGMLDDLRARGEHVVPECPFIRSWIERHPDYADLLAT